MVQDFRITQQLGQTKHLYWSRWVWYIRYTPKTAHTHSLSHPKDTTRTVVGLFRPLETGPLYSVKCGYNLCEIKLNINMKCLTNLCGLVFDLRWSFPEI